MKTTVELLNEIANKLGDENADQYTTKAQALGAIANALGDTDPDKIQTVSESLEEVLSVVNGGGGGGGSAKITFDITTPEGVTLEDYVEMLRFSNSKEETSQSVYITGGATGPMSNFVIPIAPELVTSSNAPFRFYDADENAYIFSGSPQIEGNIALEDGLYYVITGDCKITGTVVLKS